MRTIYNKTKGLIGCMSHGVHVRVEPTDGDNVGTAVVSPKVSKDLMERFPDQLTCDFSQVDPKSELREQFERLKKRNAELEKEIAELKKAQESNKAAPVDKSDKESKRQQSLKQ